ncbi:MAG: protein translocase subunit SecD [Acidobacteria bacterium]|nr:protein translocase subunit SecD [Acidobacteriota bacterium]MCA1641462.1 protein translocase subunit SecD [Acidobacteriota bacterium]
MKKNLTQRAIVIAIVTLVALFIIFRPRDAEGNLRRPQASDFTWAGIKGTLQNNIHLGLDLRGGSHLVMQVQVQDYMKRLAENARVGVEKAAKDAGHDVKETRADASGGNYNVVLKLGDASKASEARDEVAKKVDLRDFSPSVSGDTVTWALTGSAQRSLGDQATQQAMKIIDSRINSVGVAEPTLQEHGGQGSHQILLQMPGIQDPERIKKLIIGQSRLELMKVVSPGNPSPMQTYATEEEAKASLGGQVPPNRRVLPYSERDEPTAAGEAPAQPNQPKRWVVVESPAVVDGTELRTADALSRTGNDSDYEINFTLKPSGAEKFGAWTGANVGAYMAVVLNDEVKSAPYIKSQITDSGQITGRYTKQSAEDMALTLRSGALPAKLVYLEERTVGPSLGQDSIRAGVTASAVGLALVVAFMLFYYRGAGVNAVIALILNMILTIAALILFDATLTLPGIAGIILTIGMAVDSNVLIFERIREELQTGKTIASAIEQGFARAFVTIIDTHVTTIVSSLFLFVFGTGPIRGFSVTLILGLVVNLFSAVYVSRTIFIWLLNRRGRRMETLSI